MALKSNSKEMELLPLFKRFINDCKSGKRVQGNGHKLSAGSINNYGYCYKLLENFSVEKQFYLRVRHTNKLKARELLVEKNYWKKFYRQFTDYLYMDCNHFDNYVGANFKIIRSFLRYLSTDLLIDAGSFYKTFYVHKENIPVLTLMPEELNFLIYNKEFEAGLSPVMQRVKDVFVFGCTVALRFSDLMQLKQSNLRINGEEWYLQVRSQKTHIYTQVRLPDYAIDILKKYIRKKRNLLPAFNKTNMNKYVKLLAEKAGYTQQIEKHRTRRGKQVTVSGNTAVRFCDLVTTHTMRRSAITVMLSLGVPEQVVRKISGHASGSKDFYKYVAVVQTYQDRETTRMFDKMRLLNSTAD
jgi:site-specific recombinase XerD